MPFRALLWSVVTAALALLAVGLWVKAVEPFYRISKEADRLAQSETQPQAAEGQGGAAAIRSEQHRSMVAFMKAVMLGSFLLIVVLFAIGVIGSMREWVRYVPAGRKRVRTRYVDAWKIAGERMEAGGEDGEEGKPRR